jgi:hypothetical protein
MTLVYQPLSRGERRRARKEAAFWLEVEAAARVLMREDGMPMASNGVDYFAMYCRSAALALKAAEKVRNRK